MRTMEEIKRQLRVEKLGSVVSRLPQCNGLPFSSYLDSERSNPGSFDLPMGDNACKIQEDNTERVTVPESYGGMGGGGVGLGGSVSHHQLSPVQSSPEGAETTTMPNSTSNLSIGQDVNQNITADGANNASFKKRGSITFVITDHSDPNQERKTVTQNTPSVVVLLRISNVHITESLQYVSLSQRKRLASLVSRTLMRASRKAPSKAEVYFDFRRHPTGSRDDPCQSARTTTITHSPQTVG